MEMFALPKWAEPSAEGGQTATLQEKRIDESSKLYMWAAEHFDRHVLDTLDLSVTNAPHPPVPPDGLDLLGAHARGGAGASGGRHGGGITSGSNSPEAGTS